MKLKKYTNLREQAILLKEELGIKYGQALNIIAKRLGYSGWCELLQRRE